MNRRIAGIAKEILYKSPGAKYFFPRFLYNFNAAQLCFLCECIEKTRDVDGNIAEIGCSDGATTLFLNNYMDAQNIRKTYFAVDTFSGFVAADVRVELSERGKAEEMFEGFRSNKKKWFEGTMRRHNVERVSAIETDVNEYDLTTLEPLSFVILDVDLYRPMSKALPELYKALSPGGLMVVDDCDPSNRFWDGADQAYREFMSEIGKLPEIHLGKLGIVSKEP